MSNPQRFLFPLALLLTISLTISAQPISKEKALTIAQQLHQRKMLNTAGKEALINAINTGDTNTPFFDFWNTEPGDLNNISLLSFCYGAFLFETLQRSGMALSQSESKKATKEHHEALEKFKGNFNGYRKWKDEWDKKHKSSLRKVPSLEDKIVAEDSVADSYWALPLYVDYIYRPSYIDKSRSAFGKTRTRTAKDIFDVGLIDEAVYHQLTRQLTPTTTEAEVIRLAIKISKLTERYPEEKAEQLALLDSLTRYDILSPSENEKLKASYTPHELKSDWDIFHSPILWLNVVDHF